MNLINEQNHVAFAVRKLFHDTSEALLELAAVFRPGHQRSHVELNYSLLSQRLWHQPRSYLNGKPLDDRSFADTGVADQHGVTFRPATQHLHDALDLFLAANDGIKLAVPCAFSQVSA